MDPLARHIATCNNSRLPGARLPLRVAGQTVGWLLPDFAKAVAGQPGTSLASGAVTADAECLPGLARAMAAEGWFDLRAEIFDVRAQPDGPVLGQMDRGALPSFGVMSVGVHVSGLVRSNHGLKLWIGRRARSKHLDPGKLDHIVAGGIPAGMTAMETLAKEAAEEAALPAALAAQAVPVAQIAYAMERKEGLRRDLLLCYDLDVPPDFEPEPADDEVERFELWPIERALATARDTDDFKFNVNLVLIDLFLRFGLIEEPNAGALRSALSAPAAGAPGVPA
jgi:thiamine pyrophosphokinase